MSTVRKRFTATSCWDRGAMAIDEVRQRLQRAAAALEAGQVKYDTSR